MNIKINDIVRYKESKDYISLGIVFKISKNTIFIKKIKEGIVTNIKKAIWVENIVKVMKQKNV